MANMAATAQGRRAIVIGGSMSGLFAGLLLRKRGFEVEIHERVERAVGRGAGIVAQPVVVETLRGLGIDPVNLGVAATAQGSTATAAWSVRSDARRP
jgi:2-polyprenyl-6-methoxyphenol hydroxylase-like FAD-dependent oxidoreductase